MARILVADDDADIRRLLEVTLRNRGHEVVAAESGAAALYAAEQAPPDLFILDVNMPEMEGTQVARVLRERPATAQVPIILLTALAGEADTLAGFAAGADDYVTKPFNARELAARVTALLARSGSVTGPSARPGGRIVAVAGPKGGVGRTTVAVNLALAAHTRNPGQRTILLDANYALGDVGVHLDLQSSRSLLDLIPYQGRVDVPALENVLVRHASGLQVLLRPEAVEQSERIAPLLVREVLHIAAAIADLVVVDLEPRYDEERTLAVLESASAILMVVTPEIGTILNAKQFLTLLPRLGIDPGRVRLVLNRVNERAGVSPRDVGGVLGMDAPESLPEAGPWATEIVNLGVPVVQSEPRSELARRLQGVAAAMVESGAARRASVA